jgi:hypothetical protein
MAKFYKRLYIKIPPCCGGILVRKKGLEPPRREAPDPKSGAATNYATSAVRSCLGLQR